MILHELERIIVNVTEQLDAGLNTPVIFIVLEKIMSEEEATLKTTHVAVRDGVTVDDLVSLHLVSHLGGLVLINPVRERPVLSWDLAIERLAADKVGSDALEVGIERLVVEEHPVVVELAIEPVLNLSDTLRNVPDVIVSGQGNKGSLDALSGSRGCDVYTRDWRSVMIVVRLFLGDFGDVC